MPFLFTLPNAMRVFVPVEPVAPVAPKSRLLTCTDQTYPAGNTFVWREITVGRYEHHDTLVLMQEGGDAYLLVEEIDPDFREIAYAWTGLYERLPDAGAALLVVLPHLIPLLEKYMRRVP